MTKVMTMTEAVSKYVKSGDTIFIAGMQHGEPSAAVHEILRQKIDNLTLISALVATSTLMIGEGLVNNMVTGFTMQDPKRHYAIAKAKKMGKLPVFEEYSHFGISLALLAGQMGIPFMPVRSQIGSDMPKYNNNIKTMEDPFTGELIGAVRAMVPDAGIIHVQRSDGEGNAQRWGTMGVDREGINASRKVIVTTEKIVDSRIIRNDPNRTIIPGFRVCAVVEQPWGAHPMHLAGCYNDDMWGFYRDIGLREGYESYMEKLVYGVKDWEEYLREKRAIKGEDYFEKFRIKNPVKSEPVITGY